ncbi:MAG: hypothetical protein HY903_17450 [Deltaproteobacteria bacterium]|nr:hypothetical protein [Deltaproteobacteria bacterium]
MTRRALAILTAAMSVTIAACGSDTPAPAAEQLPQAPQILPNAQEGVIGFALSVQGESQSVDAVFVNGGTDPLVLTSIELVPHQTTAFTLGHVEPASLTVESRHAIGIPISFTCPGRGVYLADLVIKSNAANYPELTLQVVAPGAGLRVPEAADIEPFESTVTLATTAGLAVPAGLVRLYNLGGASLELQRYSVVDTTNFAFLSGTAVPGAVCAPGAACVPVSGAAQGCCGNLTCVAEPAPPGNCESILLGPGRFIVFGVTWASGAQSGSHTSAVLIQSNDPDTATLDVTVSGTK